jgi:hypothetical protein
MKNILHFCSYSMPTILESRLTLWHNIVTVSNVIICNSEEVCYGNVSVCGSRRFRKVISGEHTA